MGHKSIAILRRGSTSLNDSGFEYLVLKSSSKQYQFFEIESNVIGGEFDYSAFKNHILKFLKLPHSEDENYSDFKSIDFFKSSNKPHATSYVYHAVRHVPKGMSDH